MKKNLLAGAIVSLLVGVCGVQADKPAQIAQPLDFINPAVVSSNISIKRDDFKKLTEFLGPNLARYPLVEGLYIRAWRPDTSNSITYQIYINNYYFDKHWHFYDSAWDSAGTKLKAISVDRSVERCFDDGCARNEHIGIVVDRNYLDARVETGEKIQISGKAGSSVFNIPSGYIRGFLNRVDDETKIRLDGDSKLKDKMIGEWSRQVTDEKGENRVIQFSLNSDGTFIGKVLVNSKTTWYYSGTWAVKDNKIMWNYTKTSLPMPESERIDSDEVVSVDTDKLMLLTQSGGKPEVYVRTK